MPFKCPSCGEINRDEALMCSLCQALFKKVAPRHPPAVTGHPAWPRIQRDLDAARAAVAAENWDESRRLMHDALAALPPSAAAALVVSLGRQWAAALRLDPPTRARLTGCLDRFRAALDQGRFPDAAVELKAASELTADQVTDDLPIVAFGMQCLANRTAAPPKTSAEADFTAMAEQVAGQKDDPFFGGFGFLPDFSPASLVVLDAFMDSMWGTSGEAPTQENWDPSPGKQRIILQFGSYLGETLRRLWRGEWKHDERGLMWTIVALPQDISCVPFGKVYRRFKNGREDSLFGLYQSVRQRLGPPPGERESYVEHARRLRAHDGPAEAAVAAANLESLAAGGEPFGHSEHQPGDSPHAALFAEPPKPDFEGAQNILGTLREFDGITLDASLGSLIAIDGVLDELWGSAEDKKTIDTVRAESLVEPLAAYVGEVAVRHFGARWTKNKDGAWILALPGGTAVDPRSFVKLRLDVGWSHDLWHQLETARALDGLHARTGTLPEGGIQLTQDDQPAIDAAAWTAIGDYGKACYEHGRTKIAARLFTSMTWPQQPRVQAQGHYLLSVCALKEKRFDDMIAELDRALALEPDVPAWVENKGVALLELKRFDEARPWLERAIALDAGTSAYYNLGNSYRDVGRLEEAVAWYQRAVGVDASYADAWVNLSDLLVRLGRHEEAVAAADRAIALGERDSAQAHNNRAAALRALGRRAEAIDAFANALDNGVPHADQVWLERAQLERTIARNDDALRSLAHMKSESPAAAALRTEIEHDAVYLFDKANEHAGDGRTADSITWYRRVLDVEPSHADAHRQLAIALAENGELDAALAQFDLLVAAHPDNLTAQDNRATLLVRMGRLNEALPAFNDVLAKRPSASTYKRRGFCLASLGRPVDALADYVRSVEADPTYVEGWLFRAETEQLLGKMDEAKLSWRRVLAIPVWPTLGRESRVQAHRQLWELEHPGRVVKPEAAEPFRQEAFRLAGFERYADALAALDRALQLDPVDAESWQNKGAALAHLGRREEAVDALRKAVEYDAPPPNAARGLARLLVGLERWQEALAVLDRLIAIDANNAEYRQLKAQCLERIRPTGV